MEANELYLICGIAFLIVFLILAFLALLMRIIMLIFPEKRAGVDAAMIVAVTTAVQSLFPGTKITREGSRIEFEVDHLSFRFSSEFKGTKKVMF